jgi:hypothetical protein
VRRHPPAAARYVLVCMHRMLLRVSCYLATDSEEDSAHDNAHRLCARASCGDGVNALSGGVSPGRGSRKAGAAGTPRCRRVSIPTALRTTFVMRRAPVTSTATATRRAVTLHTTDRALTDADAGAEAGRASAVCAAVC